MLLIPPRLMSVMEDELWNSTSPEITLTLLKSTAPMPSPEMVKSPFKVGHEFMLEMVAAAVIVLEKEHESAAKARPARAKI